jgi:hypothetical protein
MLNIHDNKLLALDAPQTTPEFVSRVFTTQDGRQFRMTFLVSVVKGEMKGRLVSVQPLANSTINQQPSTSNQFFLPISCPAHSTVTEYVAAFAPVVSPYTELYFFTSQPTRAPSHN